MVAGQLNLASSFDSVQFHPRTFFAQLFYQVLFPLSVPFVWLFEGPHMLANLQFFFFGTLFFGHIPQAIIISLPILYTRMSESEKELVVPTEIVLPIVLHMVHRVMVAMKYAYLSDTVYDFFRQGRINLEDLSRIQILSGWTKIPTKNIMWELHSAAHRIGGRIAHVFFYARATAEQLEGFVGQGNCRPSEKYAGLRVICLKMLLKRAVELVQQELDPAVDRFRLVSLTLGFVCAGLPSIVRIAQGHPVYPTQASVPAVLVVTMAHAITWYYFNILMQFLFSGVIDYRRRFELLRFLESLVDPARSLRHRHVQVGRRGSDGAVLARAGELPYVDLSIAENIISWLLARQIVQNFGLAFRKRIHVYLTLSFLIAILLIVLLLADVVQGDVNMTTAAVVLYVGVCIVTVLAQTAQYGAQANGEYQIHKHTIMRSQFAIRELLTETCSGMKLSEVAVTVASEDSLRHADVLLNSVLKLLDIEEGLGALTIFGMKGMGVYRTLLALLVGIVSVGFRAFSSG